MEWLLFVPPSGYFLHAAYVCWVFMNAFLYSHFCVPICVHVYICTYTYTCTHTYTYTRETETERQGDRKIETEKHYVLSSPKLNCKFCAGICYILYFECNGPSSA